MPRKLSYEDLEQRAKELEREVLKCRREQEAFRGNALRYQTLLDDAPVGIWHATHDGTGGYLNPKLAELTGLTEETAQGDGWASALHPDDRERVFREWHDFVEGKAPYHSTYRFVPREGEVRWVIGQAMPVHGVDGGLYGYIGTLTDITDRKRAEEALREERSFSDNLLESSPTFFVAVSPEGQTLMMNGTMLKSLGYEREEVLGTNYLETFVPEEEGELLLNLFNNLKNLNEPVLNESRLLTKDRHELLVEWHTRPMLKENGELDYFFSVGIDITGSRQSQQELRESEERFRAVFEGSLDAIFLADPESGEVIDANPAAEELLSRPVQEIIGLHQTQLHPAHLKSSVEEAFSKHAREEDTEPPFESFIIRSDGREIPVEILAHIIQIDGVPVLHGTFRDISERKRFQEALLESEQRYRLLAESMSDIIWTSDRDLRFSYVSPSIERFVGYAPEELIGKTVIEHLTPSSIEVATQAFLEEFAGEHTKASDSHGSRTMELQRLHKDGSVVWGELTFTILRDAKGRLAGILGVTRDITERKRAEMALQEAEEEWRSLTENSPDRIMKLDPEGGILFMNRPIHLTRGQVLGTSVLEYLTESSKPIMKACLKRVLETGEHGYCEVEHLYPDGKTRDFEVRVGPVTHSGQIVALAANATDITDRKRLEEEVMKVARLESLGILAGGIAHDFNNILTPILSNISMARIYGELDSEIDEMLTDAEKATLRAKSLTQQLLTFSKGGAPIKGVCSISKLLRDSSRFALSGSHVRCEHSLSEDLWAVEMD